eukprot:scaffold719_cov359-Prasinococcus_capsulatus_cf.AAC.4
MWQALNSSGSRRSSSSTRSSPRRSRRTSCCSAAAPNRVNGSRACGREPAGSATTHKGKQPRPWLLRGSARGATHRDGALRGAARSLQCPQCRARGRSLGRAACAAAGSDPGEHVNSQQLSGD